MNTTIPNFGVTYELITDTEEFGRYMWAFVRYCAGRRSYAPSICESILLRNASVIADPWRAHIVSHIEGTFARGFLTRKEAALRQAKAKRESDPNWWSKGYDGGGLGADHDEDHWMLAIREFERSRVDRDILRTMWDEDPTPITATFDDADDFWFMVGSAIRHDLVQDDDAVMTPETHAAFVMAHANDLTPKWVTNLWEDVTDEFVCVLAQDKHALERWEPLRDFLVDISTPDSRKPYAEKAMA